MAVLDVESTGTRFPDVKNEVGRRLQAGVSSIPGRVESISERMVSIPEQAARIS